MILIKVYLEAGTKNQFDFIK